MCPHGSVKSHFVSVRLCLGSSGFKARGKSFEVKSTSGKLLFSADEQEVVVGADKLRVMGECRRTFGSGDKRVAQVHIRL